MKANSVNGDDYSQSRYSRSGSRDGGKRGRPQSYYPHPRHQPKQAIESMKKVRHIGDKYMKQSFESKSYDLIS